LNTARNATTTTKELTTTVTISISKLEASIEQLEATRKDLATERQKYFYLNRALEAAVARLQYREQARWRRALSLLLTVVLSAVTGAASFGVFLWLYYRGVITF
jgi:septal ring factor EnvC (AmiA/AmiB activator)